MSVTPVQYAEPSPELDVLVAEKVMGWYKVGAMWCKGSNSFAAQAEEVAGCPKVWSPSIDIAAAWDVVSRFLPYIKIDGRGVDEQNRLRWQVSIWVGGPEVSAFGERAEMAICRAALLAAGVEVVEL